MASPPTRAEVEAEIVATMAMWRWANNLPEPDEHQADDEPGPDLAEVSAEMKRRPANRRAGAVALGDVDQAVAQLVEMADRMPYRD